MPGRGCRHCFPAKRHPGSSLRTKQIWYSNGACSSIRKNQFDDYTVGITKIVIYNCLMSKIVFAFVMLPYIKYPNIVNKNVFIICFFGFLFITENRIFEQIKTQTINPRHYETINNLDVK